MFHGCTVMPDTKETKLRSSDEQASPSACKNIKVVSVPCRELTFVPTGISGGVDIPEVPGCHLLQQMSLQSGSHKIYFMDQYLMNSQPTFPIFASFLTQ